MMNKRLLFISTFLFPCLLTSQTLAQASKASNDTITYQSEKIIVTGKRRDLTRNVDSNLYKIREKPGNFTANLGDVLSILPEIYVDSNGNIIVRDEYAQIYVNDNLTPNDVAKNLKANTIETVEVIANPSGSSAFTKIKIKLKERKKAGYNGNISLIGETIGSYGTDASFNYQSGKLTLNLQMNASFSNFDKKNQYASDTKTYLDSDITNEIKDFYYSHGKKVNFFTFNNAIYQYSDNGSLSLNAYLQNNVSRPSIFNGEYRALFNQDGVGSYNYSSDSDKQNLEYAVAIVNKNGAEDKSGLHTSIFMYKTVEYHADTFGIQKNVFDGSTLNNLQFHKDNIEHNYAFGQYYELNSGKRNIEIKFGAQKFDNKYMNKNLSESHWVNSNFYTENISSGLEINHKFRIKKYEFKIGGELGKNEYKFRSDTNNWHKGNYSGLYPYVYLKRKLNKEVTLKASASHKVTELDLQLLDPTIIRTGIETITYGNPNLKPGDYNHYSVEFAYDHGNANTSLSLWLKERKKDVSPVVNFNNGVYETTFLNIGKQNKYGIEYSYRKELKRLTYGLDFSKYYTKVQTPLVDSYSILDYQTYDAKLVFEYKTRLKDTLLVNFGFHGPKYGLNSRTDGYNDLNMKLTHEFKNNLILSSELDLKLSNDVKTSYYRTQHYEQLGTAKTSYNNLKLTLSKKF